jgi:hypothetical protein
MLHLKSRLVRVAWSLASLAALAAALGAGNTWIEPALTRRAAPAEGSTRPGRHGVLSAFLPVQPLLLAWEDL